MPMEPYVLEELEEALANAINAAAMSGGPVRNLPRMVGQQLLGTAGGDEDGGVFDEIDAAAIEESEVMLAEAMEAAEMSQPENPIAFVGEHLLAACATPRSLGAQVGMVFHESNTGARHDAHAHDGRITRRRFLFTAPPSRNVRRPRRPPWPSVGRWMLLSHVETRP